MTDFRLTLQTGPETEPITDAEAKAHLRITHNDDDQYIATLITAARQHVENYTRRALITQTWDYYLDTFPDCINLPMPKLQSVYAITYTDTNGATQTLSSTVYTVDTDAVPGQVYLAYGQSWPIVRSIPKAIKVRFVAGYGNASDDVPDAIRHAMLLLIGHLYENRTAADAPMAELPMGFSALLMPYRVIRF